MKPQNLIIALLILTIIAPFAHAANDAANIVITSQPTTVKANDQLNITFNISDEENNWQNLTAALYVNSVNVVNETWLNITTGANGYQNTTYFSQSNYNYQDVVYVNFKTIDNGNGTTAGNVSLTNQTNSTSWNIAVSSTALIAGDELNGLPSTGTNLGDMLGNIAPGLFKFLLLLGIGGGIVSLIVALVVIIRARVTKTMK